MSIAGIILAAGQSSRFGRLNKLLMPIRGRPLVSSTVAAYLAAELHSVVVVTGHDAERVRSALAELPVTTVYNPRYGDGQSTSLRAGLEALPDSATASVIGVADQPFLTADIVRAVVARMRETGARIVVPRFNGRRGNPVAFDRSLFAELRAVTGDVGGRPVLQRHADEVAWVDFADPRPGRDIDLPEDLHDLD